MIVLSNNANQTLQPGQSMLFNEVIRHTGNGECHRKGSGTVTLKQKGGCYVISFSGNIQGTVDNTTIQLNIQSNGASLPETTMILTPSTAVEFNNVSTTTSVGSCCAQFDNLTVVNTGTTPIVIGANPSFMVRRVG